MSADSGLPVFKSENKTIFTPDFSNAQNIRNMFDSFQPHIGYKKLLEYCNNKNYYIMTSNIDRYFARAGFGQVSGEVKGSMERLFNLHKQRSCVKYDEFYICDVFTFLNEFFRRLNINELLRYTMKQDNLFYLDS